MTLAEHRPDAATTWSAVLDAFERILADQERYVDEPPGEQDAPPVFVPPTGLPPMPAEIVDRARELVERNERLLERARELAARTRPRHPVSRPRASATPNRTPMFDRRA